MGKHCSLSGWTIHLPSRAVPSDISSPRASAASWAPSVLGRGGQPGACTTGVPHQPPGRPREGAWSSLVSPCGHGVGARTETCTQRVGRPLRVEACTAVGARVGVGTSVTREHTRSGSRDHGNSSGLRMLHSCTPGSHSHAVPRGMVSGLIIFFYNMGIITPTWQGLGTVR